MAAAKGKAAATAGKGPATTAVAKKAGTAVGSPGKPMGRGFEEADSDSFAIPFLAMLQKVTPQADPDSDSYIKGAKAGMFMNTVTLALYESVEIIPCAYQRRFNRWAPRDAGGGFKGQFMPSAVPGLEASGTIKADEDGRWFFSGPDGSINEKKCDTLTDTRMHYCLQVLEDGTTTGVLVSLSRSQVKTSKKWMSLMQNRGGDMFATVYVCVPKSEENDKGTWKGWDIQVSREAEAEEAQAGELFYASVSAGHVKVKMEGVAADD